MKWMKKWNDISKTKQVQRQLQSEIDQIAPDIFSNILECVKEEKKETPIEWYEKYNIRRKAARRTKRRAWVVAAACLFLCIVAAWQYDVNYSTACTVMLDVNPSIQMEVSKSGRILSMKSNNEDGEPIVDTIKKEKSLNKALMKAMEELERENYFEQEESAMLLSYVPKKNVKRVNEIMEETVEEYQKSHEKSPKAIIMKVIVNSQVENLSQKESVSVGKSAFCIKTAAKVPKTAEELSNQNISEIAKTYYDENYPSQDEDIRLKQREKEEERTTQEGEKEKEEKNSETKKEKAETKTTKTTKTTKEQVSQEGSKNTSKATTKESTEKTNSNSTDKAAASKENDTTVTGITTKEEINHVEGSGIDIKDSTDQSSSQTALKIKKVVGRKNQQLIIKFNQKTVWDGKTNMVILDKDKNPVDFTIISQTEEKWVVQVKSIAEGEKYQIAIEGIKAQGAKAYKTIKKKFVHTVKENNTSENVSSASVSQPDDTTNIQKESDKGVTTKKPNKTSSHDTEKNEHQKETEEGEETESVWNPEETTTQESEEWLG